MLERDRLSCGPASAQAVTEPRRAGRLHARLRIDRIGAWGLAPLLPAYVVGWLMLQLGPGAADDDGPLIGYARALLHGHYATVGTMSPVAYLWHGPALPLLLAPMVWLHLPIWAMRLLTGPLLLFVAVVLFHRLLRLRLHRRASLAGAYALGLYVPFGYLFRSLAKEELALVVVVVAMYGTARALTGGGRRHVLLAGLALGVLVYDRLEYGWLTIVMVLLAGAWTLGRRRRADARRMLAICAIAAVSCIPWLAYTESITGQPLYWGNSGGLSLYWMSSPTSPGYGTWFGATTVSQDPALAPWRPFFRHVDRLPPLAANQALQSAAIRNIRTHPARYLLNVAANATRMLFAAPFAIRLSATLSVAYSLFSALLLAGIAGTVRWWRRGRRAPPPEAAPFVVFLVLGFGIHLLPSADPRMLMPLVPVMVWLCAQRWAPVAARQSGPQRDDHAARRHRPSRIQPGSRSRARTETPPPPSGARGGPRRRVRQLRASWTAAGVTLALLTTLVTVGVTRLDAARVVHVLAHVNVVWIAVALVLAAASSLSRAECWFAVIRAALPNNHLGRRAVRRGLLIGNACSTVAPGRVGEPARAWIVARRLGSPGQHLAVMIGTVVSQNLLNLLGIATLALVAFSGAAITGARPEMIMGTIVLATGILGVVFAGPRILRGAVGSRFRGLRRFADWSSRQLTGIRRGLVVFRQPRTIAHAISAQLNGWALQLGCGYAVILALGLEHHVSIPAAAAVLLAINLSAIVPITTANIGIFQAASIAALASVGIAAGEGLAYGVILQAVEIASALTLGLLALLREGLFAE